jgi:hypothetical protein
MQDETFGGGPGLAQEGAHVPRHLGLALFVIAAAQLMIILDATIVNVALPQMQRALGFSGSGLEWIVTAYSLAFGSLLLLGGRLGDLYGRRQIFMTGVAVFSIGSLLGGFANGEALLLWARPTLLSGTEEELLTLMRSLAGEAPRWRRSRSSPRRLSAWLSPRLERWRTILVERGGSGPAVERELAALELRGAPPRVLPFPGDGW